MPDTRPDYIVSMMLDLQAIKVAQQSMAEDIREIKDRTNAINGTVRCHGEKLAAHDTYISLVGLGGVGGAIAFVKSLLGL